MARTRLRQLDTIKSSITYVDTLNSGDFAGASAEGLPGDVIGTADAYVASVNAGTNSIVVDGNFDAYGANLNDRISLTGGTNDGVIAIINSSSYIANINQTTFVVTTTSTSPILITDNSPSTSATITVDPVKNVERDLNFIRTQLRKLNQKPHWYSDPAGQPVDMYSSAVTASVTAGTPIDVGGNYNAGIPYDLKVYLNGSLLFPSDIESDTIVAQHDYQELDNSNNLVDVGQVGRKIELNFNLFPGDILQFIWSL